MILNKKKLGLIIFLVIFVIILHYLKVLRPIEHGVLKITNPAIRFISRTGEHITNFGDYFSQKKDMIATIEALEDKLQNTQLDTTQLKILEEENKELRAQLGFKKQTGHNTILSYVVGKTIDNTANTIIIDKGSRDGIKAGQPAITSEGILVGTIAKIDPQTSIIRLINDPQSKIAATVLNSDRSIGLIEGGFGVSTKLTTVLQSESLNIGDLIVTSGLEESIQRGLLIGTVASIKKEDYAPFQEAVIQPSANLSRLTVIGIIQ